MTEMNNDEAWNLKTHKHEEMSKDMMDFLTEIESVCLKFNLSISHEDAHGAFIVEGYNRHNLRWLANAYRNF